MLGPIFDGTESFQHHVDPSYSPVDISTSYVGRHPNVWLEDEGLPILFAAPVVCL